VAFEIDAEALLRSANTEPPAPRIWTYPIAKEDIALVVPRETAASDVLAVLIHAAGDLLEEARLFDVYEGSQVPSGSKSLAFALRFRAPDRTLSSEEVLAARTRAVEAAASRFGAVLRG
jgi:phenylalanyl-tRNA synthetase beta chain